MSDRGSDRLGSFVYQISLLLAIITRHALRHEWVMCVFVYYLFILLSYHSNIVRVYFTVFIGGFMHIAKIVVTIFLCGDKKYCLLKIDIKREILLNLFNIKGSAYGKAKSYYFASCTVVF